MKNLKNKSSKETFENISNHCFTQMVPYKHSIHTDRGSDKYKKGRISAYEWVNNLSYYYIKQEETLKEEFILYLKSKYQEIDILKQGDYKKGLQDTLNEVLEKLK